MKLSYVTFAVATRILATPLARSSNTAAHGSRSWMASRAISASATSLFLRFISELVSAVLFHISSITSNNLIVVELLGVGFTTLI